LYQLNKKMEKYYTEVHMNKRKSPKLIVLSILAIALSLTLVSCNKSDKTTETETSTTEKANTETTAQKETAPAVKTTESVAAQPKSETTLVAKDTDAKPEMTDKTDMDSTPAVEMEDMQLDLLSLGFEIKDNLLYFNNNLLSVKPIVNYTIEKDEAIINNSDSSSIIINNTGDIEAMFPVGLKLTAKEKLSQFELSYGNISFVLPSIVSITEVDDWYKIALAENIDLSFDETTIEVHVDGLLVDLDSISATNTTMFNDVTLTTSNIVSYYVNEPNIQLSYEDGSVLTHTIGGDTTYTQKNGMEILGADAKSTFNVDANTADEMLATTTEEVAQDDILPTNEEMGMDVETLDEGIESLEDSQSQEMSAEEVEESLALTDNEEFVLDDNDNFGFGDLDEYIPRVDKPNHIGVVGNYSLLYRDNNGATEYSYLGAILDVTFEKEVSPTLSIALEIGLDINKFGNQKYKFITPMFTLDYNFKELNTDSIIPYISVGVGSMIPFLEDDLDSTYFRAQAGAGLKYNISDSWMLRVGANYNFNISVGYDIFHGVEVPVGIMYKF
jgi:opacity protein-like surface antigen